MKESKPESKQFSLKGIEMRMLEVMGNRHQEEFGNFLTFVATERLAYPVTPNTQFTIERNNLNIVEKEPAKEEEHAAPEAPTPEQGSIAEAVEKKGKK